MGTWNMDIEKVSLGEDGKSSLSCLTMNWDGDHQISKLFLNDEWLMIGTKNKVDGRELTWKKNLVTGEIIKKGDP